MFKLLYGILWAVSAPSENISVKSNCLSDFSFFFSQDTQITLAAIGIFDLIDLYVD